MEQYCVKVKLNSIVVFPSIVTDEFHEEYDIDFAIIADMSEGVEQLKLCRVILQTKEDNEISVFITYDLKQLFVDFFITVEDLTSVTLKELKKFKIGIDMKQALEILLDYNIIDDSNYTFLNEARLVRNRISHR